MTLEQLNTWIKTHGFKTVMNKTTIDIHVPVSKDGKFAGFEVYNVSTLYTARIALAY